METLNQIYNYRPLALLFLTVVTFIEQFQAISFLMIAPNPSEDYWTAKAAEFLEWLFDHFFIDTEGHYRTFYTISAIIVGIVFLTYVLFMDQIHSINSKSFSLELSVILLIDHVVMGPIASMMIKIMLENKRCNEYEELISDPEVKCWEFNHLAIMWFGMLFNAIICLLICGICPILRAERGGIEKQFGNDAFCPGLYKGYLNMCLFLFTPIKEPSLAVIAGVPVVCYFLYFEGYEEVYISKLKLASVCGIIWGFICCDQLKYDRHRASDMLLIGWGFSMAFGYSLLAIKHLFIPRRPIELTTDKLQ